LLAPPLNGQHFNVLHHAACKTCVAVANSNPLRFGIAASNELARIRAMLDEMKERRIDAADALVWMRHNDPLATLAAA